MSEGQQRPARQDAAWRRVSRDYEYEDAYGDKAEYPDQRELSGYDALNGVSAPDRPRSRPSGHPPSRYAERRAIPARRFSAPPSGPGPHRTAQPARLRDYASNGPLRSPRDTERPDAEARRMRPVAEWESWDDSASDHEPAPEDWEPPRYGGYSRRASLGWDESFPGATGAEVAQGRRAAQARRRFLATRRSRVIAAIVCVVVLLGGASSTLFGITTYQRLNVVAKSAVRHLTAAKTDLKALEQNPLDTAAIEQARVEFVAAQGDFEHLHQSLASYGAAQPVPILGGKVDAALRLAAIGVEAAQAGALGCEALALLASHIREPFDPKAQGLTKTDLAALQDIVAQAAALFGTITQQVNALQPSDLTLDARLGPLVAEFRGQLPKIAQAVADVKTLASVADPLLGVSAPARYLIEVMDSTELRPGGGFIGNYGFLTLQGGRLAKKDPIQIQDVDLLDINVKYGDQVIPVPKQYSWFTTFKRWGFRDSNLDADFPTSARNAEQLYKEEGGTVKTVGVVAITPWLIQAALRIVGPVAIPELKTTVTADNLVQQIHYNQLTAGVASGPDYILDPTTGTSLRKRFSGLLFKHFLDQLKKTSSQHFGTLVHLLMDSLSTKDLQVYLDDPRAEAVLARYHLASTIEAPPQGDSLFVVDANLSATKANYYIQQKLTDRVSIDATGAATHQTTLSYTFPTGKDVLKNTYSATPTFYASYIRIYVPPGAKLRSVSGWGPVSTSSAFGRQVWGSRMVLTYGTTVKITLSWTVPGAAVRDGNDWRYDYTLQHQAGITWQLDEQIAFPGCAQSVAVAGPFHMTGARTAAISGPFSKDVFSSASYACA